MWLLSLYAPRSMTITYRKVRLPCSFSSSDIQLLNFCSSLCRDGYPGWVSVPNQSQSHSPRQSAYASISCCFVTISLLPDNDFEITMKPVWIISLLLLLFLFRQ